MQYGFFVIHIIIVSLDLHSYNKICFNFEIGARGNIKLVHRVSTVDPSFSPSSQCTLFLRGHLSPLPPDDIGQPQVQVLGLLQHALERRHEVGGEGLINKPETKQLLGPSLFDISFYLLSNESVLRMTVLSLPVAGSTSCAPEPTARIPT